CNLSSCRARGPMWTTLFRSRLARNARASIRSGATTSNPSLSRSGIADLQVPAESTEWEHQPIQVVVDIEIAGKPGAGEFGLVPRAVVSLLCQQPRDAALRRLAQFTSRDEGVQRPRGLGCGRRAAPHPGRVHGGTQILAPTTARALGGEHPVD